MSRTVYVVGQCCQLSVLTFSTLREVLVGGYSARYIELDRLLLAAGNGMAGRFTAIEKPRGGVYFDGGPGFDTAASRSDGGSDSAGRKSQAKLCLVCGSLEVNMPLHLSQEYATTGALFPYVGRWMGLYDSLLANASMQRPSGADIRERLAGRCGS